MKNTSDLEVLVVMVHLYDTLDDAGPNTQWKKYSDILVDRAKELSWPVVYQLDLVNKTYYTTLVNDNTKMTERKFGSKWASLKMFGDRVPNLNIVLKDCDLVTTTNAETAMVIDYYNPKIILFGGLHRERCVTAVMKDISLDSREYHISNKLSFTFKNTWVDG